MQARPVEVLFLCLGNHCRSPAAEAVAKTYMKSQGIRGITVRSAGTNTDHIGQAAHPLSSAEGKRRGHELSKHKGRRITRDDFVMCTHIIVMDQSNRSDVTRLQKAWGLVEQAVGVPSSQIALLRTWDPVDGGPEAEVPDPWGYGESAYTTMFDTIERCMPKLFAGLA
jgi:protein-tyrosine phosphatase